jgi:hypothetical protein
VQGLSAGPAPWLVYSRSLILVPVANSVSWREEWACLHLDPYLNMPNPGVYIQTPSPISLTCCWTLGFPATPSSSASPRPSLVLIQVRTQPTSMSSTWVPDTCVFPGLGSLQVPASLRELWKQLGFAAASQNPTRCLLVSKCPKVLPVACQTVVA